MTGQTHRRSDAVAGSRIAHRNVSRKHGTAVAPRAYTESVSRGSNKRWGQPSQRERTGVVGGGAVQLILLVFALADLRRRRPDEINGPKPLLSGAAINDRLFGDSC